MSDTTSYPPSLEALLQYMATDPALRVLGAEAEARMAGDAAHDHAHLLRVACWTVHLAGGVVDARVAIAAALLHDVVNLPKTHPERKTASEKSAALARDLLPPLGFTAGETDLIADAIRDHSYSRGVVPATALGRALQDADRLEALGVIGSFRCVAASVALGGSLLHPADPWATARDLDDARYALDHFFTKLFQLPARFLTEQGRAEAERRAATMRALLTALGDELGAPATLMRGAAVDGRRFEADAGEPGHC